MGKEGGITERSSPESWREMNLTSVPWWKVPELEARLEPLELES